MTVTSPLSSYIRISSFRCNLSHMINANMKFKVDGSVAPGYEAVKELFVKVNKRQYSQSVFSALMRLIVRTSKMAARSTPSSASTSPASASSTYGARRRRNLRFRRKLPTVPTPSRSSAAAPRASPPSAWHASSTRASWTMGRRWPSIGPSSGRTEKKN